MNTITVCKANGIHDEPTAGVQINITEEIPRSTLGEDPEPDRNWEHRYRAFYEQQGELIADALLKSLPGGTVDQVLVALLKHKASLFVIPHRDSEGRET